MGGRSQEFICRGGSRIFSRAVEQQLSTLAYIQDAAVIGVPEGHSQQKMWGFVVLREEYDDITEDELLEHASELTETGKLHHVPDKYRILKELPKEKGKLNKDALRSIAGEKPNGDTCINTPKSKDDIVPKEQGRKTSIYIKPKNEQGKEASYGKKWVKSSGPSDENGKRNDTDVNPDTKSTDLEEKKRAQAKESTKRFNDRSAIENTIAAFPPIEEVAVVEAPQQYVDSHYAVMWAYVVLKHTHQGIVSESELLQYARNQLKSGHMSRIPDRFIILDSLPEGPNGSIDRKQLRNLIMTKKPREFDSTQGVIRPKDSFARERLSKNNMNKDEHNQFDERTQHGVESFLLGLGLFDDLAVISTPGNRSYIMIWAFVVCKQSGKGVTESELHEASAGMKSAPDRFVILDDLPKRGGRVDMEALRDHTQSPFMAGRASNRAVVSKKNYEPKVSTGVKSNHTVEHFLLNLGLFEDLAVIMAPSNKSYRTIWAFVVCKQSDRGVTESDLHEASAGIKEAPDRFIILDALPKRAGCVDMEALNDHIQSPFMANSLAKNKSKRKETTGMKTKHTVEEFLLSMGIFEDLAVVAASGNRSYSMIWAFVVCKQSDKGVTEKELHDASAGMKGAPDRFVILDDLPKRGGRVDMEALNDHVQSPLVENSVLKSNPERKETAGVRTKHTVEHYLLGLGIFEDLAVVAAPGNRSYTMIWAFVVCKQSDKGMTESDLHEASAVMKEAPDRFVILDDLPKKGGRVDMEALNDHIRSPFMSNSERKETAGVKTKHTVEHFLLGLGLFEDLAVVAAPGNRSYSMIWAFVVFKQSDKGMTESDLHDASAGLNGAPDRFVILDDLPKRAGRVDMKALNDHIQSPFMPVASKKMVDPISRRGSRVDVNAQNSPAHSSFKKSYDRRDSSGVRTTHTVEHFLLGLGIFADLAVITSPNASRSYSMIWAFVVCKQSDKGVTESELHEASAGMKGAPDRFVILDDLPKRAGRVDMEALRNHVQSPFMQKERTYRY